MGRSRTLTYIIETDNGTPMEWRVSHKTNLPGYGKPNNQNLKKWAEAFNGSFEPGGVNAHCGIDSKISTAQIIKQKTGEVLATWQKST